jgi:hypothetical protein
MNVLNLKVHYRVHKRPPLVQSQVSLPVIAFNSSYVCYSLAMKSLLSRMFRYTLADLQFTDCLQFGGLGFLSVSGRHLSFRIIYNTQQWGLPRIGVGFSSLKMERPEPETDYSLI